MSQIKPPLTSYADPTADSGLGITVKDSLGQEINPFDLVQLVNSLDKQLKGARQRAKRAEDDAELLRDQIVRAKAALEEDPGV